MLPMNKVLSSLLACLILILFWLLGKGLSYFVPLPGALLGLLLLFVGLVCIKKVPNPLQRVSQFSLKHLSLFFIAPLIAAWFYIEQLGDKLWLFLFGIILSTCLSLWATAWLGQRLFEKKSNNVDQQDNDQQDHH
jgi:holin-like protein